MRVFSFTVIEEESIGDSTRDLTDSIDVLLSDRIASFNSAAMEVVLSGTSDITEGDKESPLEDETKRGTEEIGRQGSGGMTADLPRQ
ncbi:MAG: hypothetical protein ACREHG_04590 [Candidatus Saccharimonadales bacterium]